MNQQHDRAPIVIVGASLAGVQAAETLRSEGYAGDLVMLSEEMVPPYDRPPLSKEVLRCSDLPGNLPLRQQAFYEEHRIDLRLGAAATAIDTANKRVTLADGSHLIYEKLLLTTGSRVRQVERFPYGSARVHYLRTLKDALSLRQDMARLSGVGHVLIVGAGIIGLEVAAVATELELKVTVVELGERPLARAASPYLATFLTDAHIAHGVDIRCGVQIVEANLAPDGYDVFLSSGDSLHVDMVVIGVGVVPNIELAQAAGMETSAQGIHVDGQGRSSAVDVFAAGEVAFHFNAHYGTHRRDETWQHAASHGSHVGRCMLGANDIYEEPMSYWTDQYDYSVQVFGNPQGVRDVVRGDAQSGSFTVFHMDEHGICGLTAINAAREIRKCKSLVLAKAPIPDDVLQNVELDPSRYVCQES